MQLMHTIPHVTYSLSLIQQNRIQATEVS